MSWHFSQALEAAFSAAICLDGKQSVLWNSIPFAPDDSCSDKMKDTFHRSPFGTMYAPSMDSPGRVLLMWFREDSPAKTLAHPVRVLGLTENDPAFGLKWQGLLAKYDRATSTLKTAQISLITGLHESCVTLPRWGSMRNGELFPLPIPAPTTSAKGAGSLPTPMASDNRNRGGRNAAINSTPDAYREASWLVDAVQRRALPVVCGSHDGVASGVDRLTAIGNGQVPAVAAAAWRLLA